MIQPRKFTTYERDPNGTDEAMFRRYNRWHSRFDQPDPFDGSYDLTDPQSFNRYAYVNNDPVNFTDPSGLERKVPCFNVDQGIWEMCPDDSPDVYIYSRTFADELFVINSRFSGFYGGGGGGGLQHPEPRPGAPRADWNNCHEFVDYLVELATSTVAEGSNMPMRGVNILTGMLGTRMLRETWNNYSEYIDNGFAGFKESLTGPDGMQGAGVYAHVLGNAGGYLEGTVGQVAAGINKTIDHLQRIRPWGDPNRRVEARAEIEGNKAGLRVGRHMWNYLSGRTPREAQRLRNSLRSELCN